MYMEKLQMEMIRNATDPILKFNDTVIPIAGETILKTSTNPKHPGKPWCNERPTVRKTSYIEQSLQFPHLQSESSKNIKAKSAHFLA
jgi:hypothetical protein